MIAMTKMPSEGNMTTAVQLQRINNRSGLQLVRKIDAAMKLNVPPNARFTTDELKTWFLVELTVNPSFAAQVTQKVTPQVTQQVTQQVTDYVIDHVTDHVSRLLRVMIAGEMTVPESPRSR